VTRRTTSGERGFALLIVLWTMVLLALVATRVAASGRTEAQVTANLRGAAVAGMAADAAVHEAIFHLLARGAGRWAPAGHWRVAFQGTKVAVEVEDLAGRVNVNAAPPDLLSALLDVLGVAPDQAASLAAAILDWRTPGQRPRPHGAKAPEYREAGRGYAPPGAPFRDVGELGEVLGMTPALLARLRPHVTVWGGGDLDPAFADPVVRAALEALGRGGAARGGTDEMLVAITAEATGPGGSRFARHAIVEIAPDPRGKPWRILAWTSE
jgi:general secretion pathway protein K